MCLTPNMFRKHEFYAQRPLYKTLQNINSAYRSVQVPIAIHFIKKHLQRPFKPILTFHKYIAHNACDYTKSSSKSKKLLVRITHSHSLLQKRPRGASRTNPNQRRTNLNLLRVIRRLWWRPIMSLPSKKRKRKCFLFSLPSGAEKRKILRLVALLHSVIFYNPSTPRTARNAFLRNVFAGSPWHPTQK